MAKPTSPIVIIFIVVAQLVLFSNIIRPMFYTWIRITWACVWYIPICIVKLRERQRTTHKTQITEHDDDDDDDEKKLLWARHTHEIRTRHIFVEHEERGQLSQTKARSKKKIPIRILIRGERQNENEKYDQKKKNIYVYQTAAKIELKRYRVWAKYALWIFCVHRSWERDWFGCSVGAIVFSCFFLSFNQTLVCKMSGLLKLDLCAYSALNTPMLNHNHSYCQANCDGHVVEYLIWCIYLCLLQ